VDNAEALYFCIAAWEEVAKSMEKSRVCSHFFYPGKDGMQLKQVSNAGIPSSYQGKITIWLQKNISSKGGLMGHFTFIDKPCWARKKYARDYDLGSPDPQGLL